VSANSCVGEAVHIFESTQQVEVVDRLEILAGNDHLPYEDGSYAVALAAIVLVKGHDEKAVVGQGPLYVSVQVLLQPAIALLDGAIVHVVVEVRYHE